MNRLLNLTLPFIAILSFHQTLAGENGEAFAESALSRILPQPSVRGDDPDWFFLVKELRHIGAGQFWTKPWEETAANGSDPVPSITEFNELLAERGIRLLLVPVPAKASIYPEKLDESFASGDPYSTAPFLTALSEKGVRVIDTESDFVKRRESSQKLFCSQDAHYSPFAIETIADRIATELEDLQPNPNSQITLSEPEMLTITGDQIVGSEWEGQVPGETLPLRKVKQSGKVGVSPDSQSPVLLLGDSHTLVFHEGAAGGMHCEGAGLADHLSQRLGFAVDLVGVRGSGMVQARKQLFYKATSEPEYWSRKKVVIWVFSMREFTQSTDRLISIPLDR